MSYSIHHVSVSSRNVYVCTYISPLYNFYNFIMYVNSHKSIVNTYTLAHNNTYECCFYETDLTYIHDYVLTQHWCILRSVLCVSVRLSICRRAVLPFLAPSGLTVSSMPMFVSVGWLRGYCSTVNLFYQQAVLYILGPVLKSHDIISGKDSVVHPVCFF